MNHKGALRGIQILIIYRRCNPERICTLGVAGSKVNSCEQQAVAGNCYKSLQFEANIGSEA